jgi:hypothetical protein
MRNFNSSPTVTNCRFEGNWSYYSGSGGGMHNFNSSPTVTRCTFSDNHTMAEDDPFTPMRGGGMANFSSSPTVIDCVFSGNTAEGAGSLSIGLGGGMYNANSSPTLVNCIFADNIAAGLADCQGWSVAAGRGGGIYNGADSSPKVLNCAFIGNTAVTGGGMYVGGSPMVINCTFTENTAPGLFPCEPPGGGMYITGSPTVTNCIFWGDTSGEIRGALPGGECGDCNVPHATPGCSDSACQAYVCNEWPFCCFGPWDAYCADLAAVACGCGPGSIAYSNIEGQNFGPANISTDPLFVDPGNGDYRLSLGSPCIDAGHNWAIADLADTDLDGNPRFADDPPTADTGCGVPVVVDMGAYEFQGESAEVVFADLTGDGVAGLDDFEMLLNCWSSSDEPCCVADLDLDGTVGVVDFLMLLGNWG